MLGQIGFNPVALRMAKMAKTLWSFDQSECNRVKKQYRSGPGILNFEMLIQGQEHNIKSFELL